MDAVLQKQGRSVRVALVKSNRFSRRCKGVEGIEACKHRRERRLKMVQRGDNARRWAL